MLAVLEETDYRPQLASIKAEGGIDLVAVERALRENLNLRYHEILEMIPKERKGTVQRLLQRVDLWNLKSIVTAIHNRVPKEQRLKELMPSPTLPWERLEALASAENFDRLLEFLKGSEYFDVLSEALKDYEKRGLIALLAALDKHYFTALWEDVLKRKAQRQILKSLETRRLTFARA